MGTAGRHVKPCGGLKSGIHRSSCQLPGFDPWTTLTLLVLSLSLIVGSLCHRRRKRCMEHSTWMRQRLRQRQFTCTTLNVRRRPVRPQILRHCKQVRTAAPRSATRLLSRALPAQQDSCSRACRGLPGLYKATQTSYTATVGDALARGGKSNLPRLGWISMVQDSPEQYNMRPACSAGKTGQEYCLNIILPPWPGSHP